MIIIILITRDGVLMILQWHNILKSFSLKIIIITIIIIIIIIIIIKHNTARDRVVPRLYHDQGKKHWRGTSPFPVRMRCCTSSQHPLIREAQLNMQQEWRPSNIFYWNCRILIRSSSGADRENWPTISTRSGWSEGNNVPLSDDLRSHSKRKRTGFHQYVWYRQYLTTRHSHYNFSII